MLAQVVVASSPGEVQDTPLSVLKDKSFDRKARKEVRKDRKENR